MSRIQQEPQHIHGNLVEEVNEMSVRIKLANANLLQGNFIGRNAPSMSEIADLLDKVVREMNQCTKPFKVR